MKAVKQMIHDFWPIWILAFILGMLLGVLDNAKADCVAVWRPGMVTYVDAGHPMHFIVEAEDVQKFVTQPGVAEDGNNIPVPARNGIDTALALRPLAHYCGDFREVEDGDLTE